MSAGPSRPGGTAEWLRRDAERISGALPPLMAEAERLAHTVVAGVHGRRRAGPGESFWQYRHAVPGDSAAAIDWRHSARSDSYYIREMEWESAQSVQIWADDAQAMDYRSDAAPRSKADRAALLALALSVLLVRGGERVGLMGSAQSRPRPGENQLTRIAMELSLGREQRPDYGAPPADPLTRGGRAVFLSDFMGPSADLFDAIARAAESGVSGALVQILDPAEESFPFDGRVIFRSMAGVVDFETQRARALREAYVSRLAERREMLAERALRSGWQFLQHRTSESPRKALLWLYMAIGGDR
ncbi:DUF58 domain-containing protein [Paroceanicella profunda]|uniref:DUF58 domain-containing protein n=1 Tax=Paroceanicella profunda TaxID=2579971 RepID=A0A5B8FG84_9RHOB|nr:DUF58 domain-containing protein [Paroceanicella profunda]QDL90817.1 DUF58 domain-containing protein [Paroceanicella profunda]